MKTMRIGAICLLTLLSAGCTTDKMHEVMRAKAAPVSNFLPHHELLVEQPATFPFHFFYLSERAANYENVFIELPNIDYLKASEGWAKFDAAMAGKFGAQIDKLRDFTRKAYEQAFRQMEGDSRLKVTDRKNAPKTLVLEPAFIAIRLTKAELAAAGTVASFAVPVVGMATSALSAGSLTVECLVRDAKTGEIVAMYADTENDPTAVISVDNLTWTRSTRINVKAIAAQTAKVLSAKDYRTIRRDFPIRLFSRIKDASL